jgi:hypothetical protein
MPGRPGHIGGGPVYPGGPVDPGYGVGIERPSHPITLPPGSSLPPDQIWPPVPGLWPPKPPDPGDPIKPPDIVPPNKLAVLLWVIGVGYKWGIIDAPKPPDVGSKPPDAQPKGF